MTKAKAPATQKFRERDHRFTALPVKDVLKIRMKDLGISNGDLQKALDYPMPNVIAMIRGGKMRLPANKAAIAAKLLKVDPVAFLGKVIAENDPDLWDSISAVMGDHLITPNELALIKLVRQGLDGHDVNLAESPSFRQALAAECNQIVERENALAQAAIGRIDE